MNMLIKNLHIFILLYVLYIGFEFQTELDLKLTQAKSTLTAAEVKLEKTNRDLKSVLKFQENLDESKKRITEVVNRIAEMQRQLPSDIKDIEVTGKITSFANDLKMVNPNVTPKAEVNNKFYISKEYNFDSQGTYLQALVFFEKLEKMAMSDRILNVKYIKFKQSENSDPRSRFKILDITTTLEAYKYNTAYDPTKDI